MDNVIDKFINPRMVGLNISINKKLFSSSISLENINSIKESSLDYIYSYHYLNNSTQPVEEFTTWLKLLKNDGILYITVPSIGSEDDNILLWSELNNIFDLIMDNFLRHSKNVIRLQLTELYKSDHRVDNNLIYITQWKFYYK